MSYGEEQGRQVRTARNLRGDNCIERIAGASGRGGAEPLIPLEPSNASQDGCDYHVDGRPDPLNRRALWVVHHCSPKVYGLEVAAPRSGCDGR